MEKYETIDFLGEGSFAKVSKAKDLKTGDTVAIKKLKKKYPTWQECVDLREVKSLNKLKHNDNIIKLKEMIRIEDSLYLVFEYMEKNLYQLIIDRQNKKFSEAQIKCILHQTLEGVAYMHKYGFFHRDLKPENLLVNGEKVKLADFGLAREIRSIPPYTDYVSTRYYRAPECILKSTNYNSPMDIWAVGCIMAELYTFKPLFYGSSEKEVLFRIASVIGTPNSSNWAEGLQLAKKLDVKFPATLSNCTTLSQMIPEASKEAIDLMHEMLKWDPNKRATAINLLQHPFFTNYPIPNRINTPELCGGNLKDNSAKKTYSSSNQNKNISINIQNESSNNIFSPNYVKSTDTSQFGPKKDDDEISNLLADTVGFNKCIFLDIFFIFSKFANKFILKI